MRRWLAISFVLACGPQPTTASTIEPSADGPQGEPASDDTDGEPEVAKTDRLPPEQRAILDQINGRYAEETNVDDWQARFEKEGREVHDKRDQVIETLDLQPGLAVADVGAGTGLFTMALAEAVGTEGKVYAVDIQPYFIQHLAKRAKHEGRTNVEVVAASAESVGLAPGSVDLIFICDAYHHIEQPFEYLATLHDALREGGRLAIIDYHRGPPGEWRYDHVRATAEEFRREIESAGFELVGEHKFLAENFFYVFRRT